MKKTQITVIAAFSAILLFLCICSLFTDADGFSSFENRYLSKRPAFSISEFFKGSFAERYESFLLDNFLLRDLSIMGFQSYAGLLYLDVISDAEMVLVNIDVDEFVTAGGQKGVADEEADGAKGGGDPYGGPDSWQADAARTQSGETPQEGNETGGTQSAAADRTKEEGGRIKTQDGPAIREGGWNNDSRQPLVSRQIPDGGRSTQTGGTVPQAAGTDTPVQQGGSGAGQGTPVQENGENGTDGGGSAEDNAEGNQTDTRLNNSLIIAGDRIMMPTGAYNLKPYGGILSEFAGLMPELNVYSITGPTSAAFYASEKYSTGSYDQSKAENIIEGSADGVTVVRAFDKLMEHRDEHIYFRSDVHWTALGAYYAYTAFCEASGQQPADIEEDFVKETFEPFLGGLYAQIYKLPQASRLKNNPEQLDYYIPRIGHQVTLYTMGDLSKPIRKDSIINTNFKSLGAYKYACFAWGDQRIERIDTDSPGGRRVLVIKDSYGSALIPFLVHNYSRIFVIDPKGFNGEGMPKMDAKKLIKEHEIDDVIFCFSIYGSGRKIIRDSLTSLLLR